MCESVFSILLLRGARRRRFVAIAALGVALVAVSLGVWNLRRAPQPVASPPLADSTAKSALETSPKLKIRLGTRSTDNPIVIRRTLGTAEARKFLHDESTPFVLFFEDRLGRVPPMGTKPLTIGNSRAPNAHMDYETERYSIWLACLNSEYDPPTFVRELSHELAHVWLGRTNDSAFSEAICIALSMIALEHVSDVWETHYLTSYRHFAPEFHEDAMRFRSRSLELAKVQAGGDVFEWIRNEKPSLRSPFDYEQTMPCAVVVETVLQHHKDAWGALTHVGSVLGEGENRWRVDFKQWRSLVKPHEQALVDDLATAFAHLRLE
jgi:hypothetical protein